ncbi:hypothetical protein N7456_003811 [Penicillium angulare]|uniref:RING-type domain-containing protein n=1 Tax=Penicillium angulare TaxID=116970 RepID=A0A9W9FVD4_9EURO|nr:hypothetical protein N7456_003811 [Penicillium angulare]
MSRRDSVVDLTSAQAHHLPSSQATSRGVKRRRSRDGSYLSLSPESQGEEIESIDLTDPQANSSLAKTLAKQREDAIKAQQSKDENKTHSILGAYKCPICMDTPEDATSTACGHLFCHRCIIECLNRADDQRTDSSKQIRGTCPVCRKSLTRNEVAGPRRSLIPLQLKLMTKKRNIIQPTEA